MSATDTETGTLDRALLEMLVCPQSQGTLDYDRQRQELVCRQSGLAYPIRNGVPILIIAEARTLDPHDG
ncbi:MAG: Trm112 family protein [Candidatus Puniceispirillales bacterium]